MTAARNERALMLRLLLPESASLTADEAAQRWQHDRRAPRGRPYVAVNMVATVDGRASVGGRTAPISSIADRQFFHALRTRVDAVMVGAGTLRTERYGRLVPDSHRREQRVAAGLDADPLAIVVSGSLDLSCELPLLADPASSVAVITSSGGSLQGCAAQVCYLRAAPVDLPAALARRARRAGVRSILCEGGPSLHAALLEEGLVDELFVTIVPSLAGDAGALSIVGEAAMAEPAAVKLQWLLECDGELFARYRVS